MLDREIKIAIVIALLVALGLIAFAVWAIPGEKKPEYPKHTPTVLPTIPAWTPDPEERGKG